MWVDDPGCAHAGTVGADGPGPDACAKRGCGAKVKIIASRGNRPPSFIETRILKQTRQLQEITGLKSPVSAQRRCVHRATDSPQPHPPQGHKVWHESEHVMRIPARGKSLME